MNSKLIFFFQAEDGIRDGHVTGVQTCALPIWIQGHWGLNYPKTEYIEAAIEAYADLGVKVMITELDIDVLPLTREGQIIGTGMSAPPFQLEDFQHYVHASSNGLPAEAEGQ